MCANWGHCGLFPQGVTYRDLLAAAEVQSPLSLFYRSLPVEPRLRPFLRHLSPVLLGALLYLSEPMPDMRRERFSALPADCLEAGVVPRLNERTAEAIGGEYLFVRSAAHLKHGG